MKLDLDKPIFVIYVDTKDMTHFTRDEVMQKAKDLFGVYTNITSWVISADFNRVECIWNGKSENRKSEISRVIKEINKRIELLNFKSIEELRINIRDLKIDQIIDESA